MGKQLKVRLSFTDDLGNPESRTSPATLAVQAAANNAPEFTDGANTTRSVAENTAASRNIGTAIAATDADGGDTLRYTLGGTDFKSFSIHLNTGQLLTQAALDFETKSSYAVSISVSDGNGGTDSISVTITVTDVNEQPGRPAAPSVGATANSDTSLDVSWTAPGLNGGPPITGYHLQYRQGTSGPWTTGPQNVSGTSAAITSLTAGTSYQVQVRAVNGETLSDWSPAGTGSTTAAANNAPEFTDGANTTRSVAENTAASRNIGTAIAATDADGGDTLRYTLGGTDFKSFSIHLNTGQLLTQAALDFETKSSYAVSISVSDGNGGTDSISVTITVTDVNEQPGRPAAPSVGATANSDTSLDVSWTAPGLNGGPPITGYHLQYRQGTSGPWTTGPQNVSGTSAAITSLTAGTSYQVQVRAVNGETLSDWSPAGTGSTTAAANNAPEFTDGANTTRSVAENTAASRNIGTAIAATDADGGDTLRYTLGGTDMASFAIVSTSGQLQTRAALDYETKSSYAVTVSVSDGNGGSDSIGVTITVTDVNEQPGRPAAPSVGATANSHTSLDVSWTAPGLNGGPAITGYHLQYRQGTGGNFTNGPQNVSGTSAMITGLTAGTSYQVQVRSLNGETPSDWSPAGTGSTSSTAQPTLTLEVGPNRFSEAAGSVQICVVPSAPSSQRITVQVATADGTATAPGDYVSHSGTVALQPQQQRACFTVTLVDDAEAEGDETFTVTLSNPVNATLGGARASVAFTIVDNDGGANVAPTFTEGTSTTRSVAENTAPLQNIGAPVAATDADSGDTLGYTLGGTDFKSFSIHLNTGQLLTQAALDFETKSSYAVSISVSDGNGGTDSISVTITVTDVNEQPGRPAAPSVGATANSDTSLDVSWTAPGLNGGPGITGYNLQYRQGTSGSFTNGPQNVSGTSAMITGLTAGTSYQVQVRSLNGETPSDWSPAGTGSTSSTAQPTLTLEVGPNRFSEAAGSVQICVVPSAPSSQRITVQVATADGTATAPGDYVSHSGTVALQPQQQRACFTVTLVDDAEAEGDETFTVTLSNPVNATLGGARASVAFTIVD